VLLSASLAANVKVFAKSFHQRIRYYIFDALMKAFCVIFCAAQILLTNVHFRALETSQFNTSSTGLMAKTPAED